MDRHRPIVTKKMMTRRRTVRLLPLLMALLFPGSCSKKTPTLNLLVWEGYADPSFVKTFEEQNHCKVSASYMGSSDELMAKLRGGSAGNYDVISPSSDVATSIASAELASASIFRKSRAIANFHPSSLLFPWCGVKGQVYGVPFMWGPDPSFTTRRFFPAARFLERFLGSEVQRQSFGVGRCVDHVYGGADSRLRQARSVAAL